MYHLSLTMSENVEESLKELPSDELFWNTLPISQWEGYWFHPGIINSVKTFKSTFQARDDDIFLASPMKTGTTWLKALALCITENVKPISENEDVLITGNPHFHVPTIESIIYSTKPPQFDLYDSSNPRLLHTHLPYTVLPDSIKDSGTKIVYIARNPKDTLISMWHFFNSICQVSFPLQKAVDIFCSGVHYYGPFFGNLLSYWTESQKRPDKILFLKYEELKSDPKGQVRKIAEFLGKDPFVDDEQVDDILRRCSLERLQSLEVNKSGSSIMMAVPNSAYFRKGVVGDWKNHLSPEMEQQIDQTTRTKLEAFGLFL